MKQKNNQDKTERYAEECLQIAQRRKAPVVCRCGETPGGTKHIGNFNDNIRSYFIYLSIKEKGYETKHIQTRDNMDPFRKLPSKIFDLKRKWHIPTKQQIDFYNQYVGMPLYFIPDPLGCCKNYAEHFAKIYETECKEMGLKDTQYVSTYELYTKGEFNIYLDKIFQNIEKTRSITLSIENSKPKDYVPVWVICEKCNKITGRITRINLKDKTVNYSCTGRNLTIKHPAKGCGQQGVIKWGDGNTKMDWEFEWPAQMLILNTTIEPFGKEHFIGSWPFAKQVIQHIYNQELPLVFFYEYFLSNKEKMATRHGNVITLTELMNILEPEVIRYLYTKRPEKQRSLSLNNIINLVNEFDYSEKVWFDLQRINNKKTENKLRHCYKRAYLHQAPKRFFQRLSYPRLIKFLKHYQVKDAESILFKNMNKTEKAINLKRLKLVYNYINLTP